MSIHRRLHCDLESTNPRNQPLHERHGFVEAGEIRVRSFATSQVLRNEMGGVAPLPIPGLTMTRSAGILYRSSTGITPAMRALIDAITTLAQELGAN